jgi:hypothetical protein
VSNKNFGKCLGSAPSFSLHEPGGSFDVNGTKKCGLRFCAVEYMGIELIQFDKEWLSRHLRSMLVDF